MRGSKKRERQDHSACRAAWEGAKRLVCTERRSRCWFAHNIIIIRKEKKKTLRKCLSGDFCRDFIVSSDVGCRERREREQVSQKHYWELEQRHRDIQFSYSDSGTRRPLRSLRAARLYDKRLQWVTSGSHRGLRWTLTRLLRINLSHVCFRRVCVWIPSVLDSRKDWQIVCGRWKGGTVGVLTISPCATYIITLIHTHTCKHIVQYNLGRWLKEWAVYRGTQNFFLSDQKYKTICSSMASIVVFLLGSVSKKEHYVLFDEAVSNEDIFKSYVGYSVSLSSILFI